MDLRRWWRHFRTFPAYTRRRFTPATLTAIEEAIASVESRHAGEIRFAVETALDKLQKDYLPFWQREFQQFLTAPVANQLEVVKAYNHAVKDIKARGL